MCLNQDKAFTVENKHMQAEERADDGQRRVWDL